MLFRHKEPRDVAGSELCFLVRPDGLVRVWVRTSRGVLVEVKTNYS